MNPTEQIIAARGKLVDALYRQLFENPELRTYAILDGASIPELLEHLQTEKPEHICLYRGELGTELAQAAPYLVRILPDTPFTEWLLLEGWGRHWGIFALSAGDITAVRKHFRGFLLVKGADGKQLYFRYYDPRVFRVYLPTCKPAEIAAICGPVAQYWMESDDPRIALQFENDRRASLSPVKLLEELRK